MRYKGPGIKTAVVAIMIMAVLWLHYFTLPERAYLHAVYRTFFYPPLILGGLWFGLKGALLVCGTVILLFSPYEVLHWEGLTITDFEKLLEGVVFVASAIVLGFLVERERNEHRRLVEAERLAAVGKAVSEVAHDMKTPLMAIGGFVSQVARSIGHDHPGRKKLDIVILETSRLETMIKEMLEFGRPLELALTRADLNQIILDCVELSKSLAKEAGVELATDLSPSLPETPLDADKVKQVLLNLISNAIQASPAGERVVISTVKKRNSVEVEVFDSGFGIKEEARERVFLPFFTTKQKGTGLGLAIVKKIVAAHGGEITFRPNPERGVTFNLSLPMGEEKAARGESTGVKLIR